MSRTADTPGGAKVGKSNNSKDVTFWLADRSKRNYYLELPRAINEITVLDVSKPTKILIHGLGANSLCIFPRNVEEAYLDDEHDNDPNVIIVDWGALAGPNWLFYIAVLRRLNTVGKRVGEFLLWLTNTMNVNLRDVHIVGHSLGAHVAGLAAQTVIDAGQRIGRISALDPAGPGFFTGWFSRRIDKNDADNVDSYHTNAGYLGTSHPVGRVSFFINGGNWQPNDPTGFTGSHSEAHKIFAQTIEDGPGKSRVTNEASESEADHDFIRSNIDRRIIVGEYCLPGTSGRYEIKYHLRR